VFLISLSDRAVIAYWWHGSWRQTQKRKEEEAYKEVEPFVGEFVSGEINRASTIRVKTIFTMTARFSYTTNIGMSLRIDLFRRALVFVLSEFRA